MTHRRGGRDDGDTPSGGVDSGFGPVAPESKADAPTPSAPVGTGLGMLALAVGLGGARSRRRGVTEGRRLGRSVGLVLSACVAATAFAGCTQEEMMQASTVRVERVIDGDTVALSGVGTTRLIGVDVPEEGRCGDDAATRFTRRRLEGKRVKVELGEDTKDRWRRTLAYVRRGDKMHNMDLIEGGYAKAQTVPPNDKYADRFEAAEDEAKRQEEGPQETCARKKRQALALKGAQARERAEARRLARDARRLRAVERRGREAARRAKKLRDGVDPGGSSSDAGASSSDPGGSDGDIPKDCSGVNGPLPTPPGDPTNLDRDKDGEVCE